MSDDGPPYQPQEPHVDALVEAELQRRLAAIKRDTESGWRDDSFWGWLVERLKFTSRRQGK
jgi:hypothetical protein